MSLAKDSMLFKFLLGSAKAEAYFSMESKVLSICWPTFPGNCSVALWADIIMPMGLLFKRAEAEAVLPVVDVVGVLDAWDDPNSLAKPWSVSWARSLVAAFSCCRWSGAVTFIVPRKVNKLLVRKGDNLPLK